MADRDYKSFTTAAKPRFRYVAKELGYSQLSGIDYIKSRNGWLDSFSLQAAGHGNDFFYVNYGIRVPDLCPVKKAVPASSAEYIIWDRLCDVDNSGGFGRESKKEIEGSADRVLSQYKSCAEPFLGGFNSWNDVASEYFNRNSRIIDESRIGTHTAVYGADLRATTYGYLLIKCNRTADAMRWLQEAERLFSLPFYITRDGRSVHEHEKGARLKKPEPYEIEMLKEVKQTIQLIAAST